MFHDVYFLFDIQPVPVSTLALQMNSNSIIPKAYRYYDLEKGYEFFEDVFQDKITAIRCILSVHYRFHSYKKHLDLFDYIINKCEKWISDDYVKKRIKMFHLANLVFFGKKRFEDVLMEFMMDALS